MRRLAGAAVLLVALTGCGPAELVCHTFPSGTVECQSYPAPMTP